MFERQQNLLEYEPTGFGRMPERGGWFDLDDWVGPGHPSTRADIAKIEGILANSGDYSLDRTQGPTGYWGLSLDDGIRKYQKRNGLKVDGALRPDGPTIEHMRKNFGALLDGHTPPTPDDIDAHHDIVGDDNPGLIAWRPPRASFANIADLPEIDQEADASNARMVRAMLRTGDVESYTPLMKAAIDQGGKRAFAEVVDLAKKLEEASPSHAGKFTGKLAELLTPEQIENYRIEVEPRQPPGTVQMAMMPGDQLTNGGRFTVDGSGGGGGRPGIAAGAAGAAAAIAAGKALEQMLKGPPGFTPAEPEPKPTAGPAPEPVEKPKPLGGSMETPQASDSVETFPADSGQKPEQAPPPALDPDEREQIVGKFLDGLNVVFNEGAYVDNRGLPKTVKLNGVTAKACAKAMSESEFPELIKQLGGASEGGEERKYMEERRINTPGKDRLPDYLMGTVDGNGKVEHGAAINTVTTRADGSPIPREQAQLDDLIKSNVIRFVDWLAKVGDGKDPEDSFDEAYRKCKEGVKILEAHIRADIKSGKRRIGKE